MPPYENITKEKPVAGAPRWMVTFADMMSLLFAMFVLLLSFANFDEVKFDVNATAMREAFQVLERKGLKLQSAQNITLPISENIDSNVNLRKESILRELRYALRDGINGKPVEIISKDDGALIRFPDTAVFSSGGDELSSAAQEALEKVSDILNAGKEKLYISGHTDDVPIATDRFRSNWDLSTARAVSVTHYLLEKKISKERIAVQGFADSRPLATNNSPKNRAKNRRVEIFIKIVKNE